MRRFRAVRAILFDWGGTLVRFPGVMHPLHVDCLRDLHGELAAGGGLGGVPWPALRDAYLGVAAEQLDFSRRTRREHRLEDRMAETLRRLGQEGAVDPAALVGRLAKRLLAASRTVDGAARVLAALRGRFRLGLLSNYPHPPTVLESLVRFRLRHPFEGRIVVSGAIGWAKPDPRAFRCALAAVGVSPAEALFVGDDLENDMRGAKAVGLATAWLPPAASPAAGRAETHRTAGASEAGGGGPGPSVDWRLANLTDLLGVDLCRRG